MKKILDYFTAGEKLLWCISVLMILVPCFIFGGGSVLSLSASLLGVTSLIFAAKGNPAAQAMMIVFCILYGIISYSFSYYGEMLTYMAMTGPMAVISLISWLRNPFNGDHSTVRVNSLSRTEFLLIPIPAAAVTVIFYFILKYFHTANLLPSTISVTTSFIAVYLTFRRSPYFAAAYASNDIVLVILWSLASLKNIEYLSVVMCFLAFLFNDIYGFISWRKMEKKQKAEDSGMQIKYQTGH